MSHGSASQQKNPLVPFAYASGVISGGVVGYDYGTWLDVPPFIGAVLGAIVSSILTGILLSIVQSKELKGKLISIGAFLGAVAGAWIMMISEPNLGNFIGGAFVGGIFGAIAGMVVFMMMFVGAVFLLLISRGPISLFLRNVLSGEQDAGAVAIEVLLNAEGTDFVLTDLVGIGNCGLIC